MNDRAEEVWRKANRVLWGTPLTKSSGKSIENAINVIAAALTQAKREGIEAMRDALVRVSGRRWVTDFSPYLAKQIADQACIEAARLLEKK